MRFDGTDIYPVGVLRTLQTVARALTVRSDLLRGKRLEIASREARKEWRYLRRRIGRRDWQAVRNAFNGYLAEHDGHPHNCGRGWTKRAAERRADRFCKESNRMNCVASMQQCSERGTA